MKRTFLFSIIAIFAITSLLSFSVRNDSVTSFDDDLVLGFPEDIENLLTTHCFDCHTADSKNDDAKKKLNYSHWENYSDAEKVAKLDKMCEEVKENKMPPKKYLEYYPDKKLDKDQVEKLCAWASEEADSLFGE